MTKQELINTLRITGCDPNTVMAMTNAYELGAEAMKDACVAACEAKEGNDPYANEIVYACTWAVKNVQV